MANGGHRGMTNAGRTPTKLLRPPVKMMMAGGQRQQQRQQQRRTRTNRLDRRAEDSDRRLDEVLTAVREVGELFAPLRDQLYRERQRADRAENRVQRWKSSSPRCSTA